ncbi:MAG: chromosome segregation protein SMC [Gammaproteobacteria bacterium]|nr:chromosome segregation protein SMC [Gammaproteobacteria bacterium]
MRLSQIKIAGFKSFVDPTKIAFPASITGIVGPNGCGKSNVIDAVRWVMGESSARHLRGESMEDVIFSGSSGRKPVGQASVELIFDNSDGRVTGEYAKYNEISVKRIATRAGQSKYFLNNARCRRRDIADIFLGTGLGPRSYSIIEQGMVSRVIDAKPEELRVYLEEAAGISKYKERRRETETRIRHTRENLDRLNDLIEEIDKQLSRLDRQSKTAEKFKQLKQEQRKLEAESLLLQKMAFDTDIETQKRKLAGVENSMQEGVAEFRKVEKHIEECRQQLVTATDQHNEIQSQYYQLGSDISGKEQSIEHQRNLRQHNRQELENIQQSLKDSQRMLDSDSQKLERLNLEIGGLKPKLETSIENLKGHEDSLAQVEQEMTTWQDQWDAFRREFHQVHESAQIENRGIEHIERQVQQSQKRSNRLHEELQTLDTTAFNREIIELEQSVEAKTQEHAATLAQLQGKSEEIQTLRQSIEQQSSQLDEKRNQVQSLRGRLSSLEALQQHVLAETSDDVRNWLARHQIDSGKRLAEILKVRNQAEKAVEVVLGPFLSAYCVEPGRPIPDDLLESHSIAIFDHQRTAQSESERDWPRLIDRVDCDVDLSGLLAGIYLCKDLQELALRKIQLKAGESLVTNDGLWVGPNWVLQLGEEDQRSGMLEREKEIKQIRQQLDEITQSALALKSRADGDRQRLQHAEQQRDEDQRVLAQLHQQSSDIQNQLTQRKGRVEQVSNRYQQIQTELKELDELQNKHSLELQTNSAKRNEMLAQIEQMAEQESSLQARKVHLQGRLTGSRDHLKQQRDQNHQLQMQLQVQESEHRATQSNIERMQQQNQQFDQRIQTLGAAIDDADQPLEGLQLSLQGLLEARNEKQQALNVSQENVTQLDNKQRQLEVERSKLQQQSEEIRNRLETQRMQCQELKIRCKTVEEQLHKTGFEIQQLTDELDDNAGLIEWQNRLEALNRRIERLGPINLAAIDEYKEQLERKQYLDAQHEDLVSALSTLESAIRKIDKETRERFKETFDHVNNRVSERFPKLFGGGEARLELTEDDLLNTGVIIMARPPGKRITNLQLLSGGEKALTAVALIFAIFELNPSPFCMLDEVDAPLDDANVGRFCAMVDEMSEQVQFIMITHNKITMEMAQSLNGVTMHEPGVSRLVSVDVGEAVEMTEA